MSLSETHALIGEIRRAIGPNLTGSLGVFVRLCADQGVRVGDAISAEPDSEVIGGYTIERTPSGFWGVRGTATERTPSGPEAFIFAAPGRYAVRRYAIENSVRVECRAQTCFAVIGLGLPEFYERRDVAYGARKRRIDALVDAGPMAAPAAVLKQPNPVRRGRRLMLPKG